MDGLIVAAGRQISDHTAIIAQANGAAAEAGQKAIVIPFAIAQPIALKIKGKRRHNAQAL